MIDVSRTISQAVRKLYCVVCRWSTTWAHNESVPLSIDLTLGAAFHTASPPVFWAFFSFLLFVGGVVVWVTSEGASLQPSAVL